MNKKLQGADIGRTWTADAGTVACVAMPNASAAASAIRAIFMISPFRLEVAFQLPPSTRGSGQRALTEQCEELRVMACHDYQLLLA